MEIIENIVFNEFTQYDYKNIASIEGVKVLGLIKENVFDYWIITSNKYWCDHQLDLFKQVVEMLKGYNYVDKNLTLLLLCDIENKDWASINSVEIENDKSYFKKYVLKYTSDAASDLANLIETKRVKSISELMMDGEVFSLAKDSGNMNAYTLIYGLSHKLAFIPIITKAEEYSSNNILLGSSSLRGVFEWVQKAPEDDHRIDTYIQTLIDDENEKS